MTDPDHFQPAARERGMGAVDLRPSPIADSEPENQHADQCRKEEDDRRARRRNRESTRAALDEACSGNSGKFHMMRSAQECGPGTDGDPCEPIATRVAAILQDDLSARGETSRRQTCLRKGRSLFPAHGSAGRSKACTCPSPRRSRSTKAAGGRWASRSGRPRLV